MYHKLDTVGDTEKSSLKKDTNYDPTNEEYTATIQELIKSSVNCTVKNVRRNTSSEIFEQKCELEIGTKIESVQRFFQLDPNIHLNSAALSQENQSSIRVPITTIDSQSFLSQLKLIPKLSLSSVCARECISITGRKHLINFLVTYLKYDLELKRPLPLFWLHSKTLPFIEDQNIISYKNIPNGCGIKLESLQSMIDGDGVGVALTLMENYYGLLREMFMFNDSSITIPHLNSMECIYQVLDIFQALQPIDKLFTNKLFPEML